MVSVAVATLPHRWSSLQTLLRLARSQLLQLALSLHGVGLRKLLTRAATAGSAWAVLAFVLGGLYEKPWQMPGVAARVVYTVVLTLCEYAARGFKPLFSEWTLSFELVRAVTRCATASYGDRMIRSACAHHIRRQSEVAGSLLGMAISRRLGLVTESFRHNELEHIWIKSKQSLLPTDKPCRRVVVLYLHGGGYTLLSPRLYIHFACELQHRIRDRLRDKLGPEEEINVDILLANYRKMPEYVHPVPALDAVTMYKYLLQEEKVAPSEIIVAGDSAGGGLTMSTLLRVRDENPALLPVAGILSCPYVDLEVGGDDRKTPYCILGDKATQTLNEVFHPRQGDPSTWGDASAVHCDLRGLPPVYIQAAELDYILPHAQNLYKKAKQDGVTDWELEVFHNVRHVFSFFPTAVMPTAARGLDAMAEFAATKYSHALRQASSA